MADFDIESLTDEDIEQYRVRPNIDVYWLPDRVCLQYYRDLRRWVGLAAFSANPRRAIVDREV